jgi:hypothetical protein
VIPHRLTPDAQAQALAEWGRGGSFDCIACEKPFTDHFPEVIPVWPGMGMAACAACARRWKQSAGFRRDTATMIRDRAKRSMLMRVADLVGVDGDSLLRVMADAGVCTVPSAEQCSRIDVALQVPAGSVKGAVMKVFFGRSAQ